MIIGKDMKEREEMLVKISKYCNLYFHGDCADGIALENIKNILEAGK